MMLATRTSKGQPQCRSEEHCAAYVRRKFDCYLGVKAPTVLQYLQTHGWSYREIYQLGRYNQLIYDDADRMMRFHDQLTSAGIIPPLIKRILISRILPNEHDTKRIIRAIRCLEAHGLSQSLLVEITHKIPRILLLTPNQIDRCRRSSEANGTEFTYYLRKRTTASCGYPDVKASYPRRNVKPTSPVRPSSVLS